MSNAFDLLDPRVRKLVEERGFIAPTDPQVEAIPYILKGENVLLVAPTGTGKTEAAFLPILSKLVASERGRGVKVLYITPLRALNRDLLERLEWWCAKLDLSISVRHGDTAPKERRKQALSPPDILVTTPETLQIILLAKVMSKWLSSVKYVIVDEVHELAESKRGAQLALALERLRWMLGRDFQVVGLSATIGTPEVAAKFLVGVGRRCRVVYVPVAKSMEVKIAYPTASDEDKRVARKLYTYPSVAARLRYMKALIEKVRASLIFTNTRPMSEILGSRFKLLDPAFPVKVHHGSLSVETRLRAERGLKDGSLKGVVCTSSLELGIDVGNIDLVIQYNSPRQVTRLVQRVGRSGHSVGAISKGVVIVRDADDALEALVIARRALAEELEPLRVPEMPLDALMHEIVGMLIVRRSWSVDEIYQIVTRAYNYRGMAKETLLDVIRFMELLPERMARLSADESEVWRSGKYERLYEYYFDNLSMIPDIKQYLVIDEERNEPVGILDENFVVEWGKIGVKFIMAGRVWKIVQVFGDRVYVKEDLDPVGAVPWWLGEEIPVPFEVAQEVGAIRAEVEELALKGLSLKEIAERIAERYPSEPKFIARAIYPIYKQVKEGLPVPTHKRIVVEKFGDTIVVHVAGGTLINRVIARFLSEALIARIGEPVAVKEDPYRVFLRSYAATTDDVVEALKKSGDLREVVYSAIEKSGFFKFRITQAARKMGVIRKNVDLSPSLLEQLIDALKRTPVYDEAFKEAISRDLDLRGAERLLAEVASGDVEVVSLGEVAEPTPLALVGLRWVREALEKVPLKRRRFLQIAHLRAKLLSEVRTFVCVSCKKYVEEKGVYELPRVVECPMCGSRSIGVVEEEPEDVVLALEEAPFVGEKSPYKKIVREAEKTAALVEKYGKAAVVAIVSGLPMSEVKRILAAQPRMTGKFFEMILSAQKKLLMHLFRG